MTTAIIVHGGAGPWKQDSHRLTNGIRACETAVARAQTLLCDGASAVDAVVAAVTILEDAPELDAGRGSYVNANGDIEMDALLMDGATLNMGAIAAVQRIQNPIQLARRVLEDTPHNLLVGAGAEAFADRIGFPRCRVEDLLVGDELERYRALQARDDYFDINHEPGSMGDTVGAVALDRHGNIAAATSTGGTRQKLPGRVGDSPLVGCGGYADNFTAGVSATGYGEALMKVVISKQVCDFVAAGLSAASACEAAIRLLAERVDGQGGLIAVDRHGRIGFAFNTDAMPHAFAVDAGPIASGK